MTETSGQRSRQPMAGEFSVRGTRTELTVQFADPGGVPHRSRAAAPQPGMGTGTRDWGVK
jgi:hypothetical protein